MPTSKKRPMARKAGGLAWRGYAFVTPEGEPTRLSGLARTIWRMTYGKPRKGRLVRVEVREVPIPPKRKAGAV